MELKSSAFLTDSSPIALSASPAASDLCAGLDQGLECVRSNPSPREETDCTPGYR